MQKGCQKKIYYLKNPGGKYFEEAYLILRSDIPEKKGASSFDLAAEAERIIHDACFNCPSPKRSFPQLSKAMSFALGAASSSAIIGIAAMIIGLG